MYLRGVLGREGVRGGGESSVNVIGRLPSTSHEENDKQGAGWRQSEQYIVIMTFGEGYCCKAVKLFHCTKKISGRDGAE